MKKLAIVLSLLLLVPASAFGMQMLSDNGMAQITGQSGVSIAMDDVQLFINIDKLAYIDNDGLSTSATMQIESEVGAPGALYIQDFQIDVLNINAIVGTDADALPQTLNLVSSSAGSIPLFYNYADTTPISGGRLLSSPGGLKGLENYTWAAPRSFMRLMSGSPAMFNANAITIEVTDRLPVLTEGFNYNTGAETYRNHPEYTIPPWPDGAGILAGITVDQRTNVGGVFITLPTAEIYIQSMGFTVAYTGNVYAHTLESVSLTLGTNDLYVGPMGALTSHAINDNEGMLTIGFGGATMLVAYPLEGDYGSVDIQGLTFTQLSGWMEIAPH